MSEKLTPQEFAVRREMETFCRDLGAILGKILPKELGFALLLFEFNGHQSSYISNANRADMIKAMREQADLLERRQDSAPIKERRG